MKKFTDFKSFKKIYEQEVTLGQTETTKNDDGVKVDNTTTDTSTEQPKSEEVVKSEPSKFFSKLLESREMAQVYHWTVKGEQGSHAAHLALESYYSSIIEHIDDLVEIYQGQYELIEGYEIIDTTNSKSKEKVEYFTDLAQFIKDTRYKAILEDDTHLQNIIDEVVALIYKTLYKLKYNK